MMMLQIRDESQQCMREKKVQCPDKAEKKVREATRHARPIQQANVEQAPHAHTPREVNAVKKDKVFEGEDKSVLAA